ncbi:MAG: hypothetical protein J6M24_04510 [Lachnospiraceae bacterium]|nr:hypothetical protein [Lachnospiraceae bacterium]
MASKQSKTEISNESNSLQKKPFIKNNTLMAIIIAIGVIGAAAVFIMNFMKSREKTTSANTAEAEWYKISDYITDMISVGDLDISYVYSSQRKQMFIAGSEFFYSVQHNGTKLYFGQGTYTQNSTTDELKISEAKAIKGMMSFSDYVTDFSVENYNQGTNSFSDGTVKIRMRVEKDGKIKQDSFSAKIPSSE